MSSLRALLKRVHEDERGAVSLETVLIIGAIALPVLIFLWNAWDDKIRPMFEDRYREIDPEFDERG